MKQQNIRNFCIIAHIDHGKSTLADRILELTGTIKEREMKEQVLDSMDLERERGITIKLQAVKLLYKSRNGEEHFFNLIDTPGHVDFSYEVSRSLAACEGALLVVDAAQGIEAQTMANVYLALEHNLEIIPVINKIDLPNADTSRVKKELEDLIGLDGESSYLVSAKEGAGVEDLLEAIVQRIPAPEGDLQKPLQALIFDSVYDSYRGVIAFIRLKEGVLKNRSRIMMMSSGKTFEVSEVGVFRPMMTPIDSLRAGDVGYVIAGIKNVQEARVGDTITCGEAPAKEPLPGYQKVTPMVYCGLFPVDSDDYPDLREALDRLKLNDSALDYQPESSPALGFGFRCGFLGLLHMEIIQQRLEREYGIELIVTAPNVVYRVLHKNGDTIFVHNPAQLPPVGEVEELSEPFVDATIIVPHEYVGAVMDLANEKRGEYKNMEYTEGQRVVLSYYFPLSEIIFDFFDLLKSRTKGYASFDYSFSGYRSSSLVKVDILVAGEAVDALSFIDHKEKVEARGRALIISLKELIPRGMFDIPLQASIGNKPFARETIKALKKNVLDKCYGGDVTRKRKLLEKQKAGKRRMKQVGRVEIPQEAFLAVLQKDKGEK